ncbi:MAG: hypothetical protein K8T10_00220 [Candidatus Eremiobacteraeota bacterium]|nr:hypothetical protein [Candidatus Eremiobacteraeota bacterium]
MVIIERNNYKYKKKQKGIALFLTLIALTLLSIIGFGLVGISTIQSKAALVQQDAVRSYYYARIGLSTAREELKKNYSWDGGSHTYVQGNQAQMQEGYTVTVWRPSDFYTTTNKVWKVTSTGVYGGSRRTLTSWLNLESFATYLYFTDREKMGSTTIWFIWKDKLHGRVHTNGYFSMYYHPQFSGKVTSHNGGDSYYDSANRKYHQGGKWYTDLSKFFHYYHSYSNDCPIAVSGQESDFSFAGEQPEVSLPANTNSIQANADFSYSSTTKLKFYDEGKVRVMNYSDGSWHTEYKNTDNITIYVDGKVVIEGGTLKGKCTVGCTGNMEIENSLVYNDQNLDVMGVVAGQNIIIKTGPYTSKNLTLHMVLMALNGSFYVDQYGSGIPRGKLTILGGLIQGSRGPVGTFSGGDIRTGYNKDYKYDKKLLNMPPPNYPTTGNVILLSIEDSASLGH